MLTKRPRQECLRTTFNFLDSVHAVVGSVEKRKWNKKITIDPPYVRTYTSLQLKIIWRRIWTPPIRSRGVGENGMGEEDGRAGAMVCKGGCDVHKLFSCADCAAHHQLAVNP